MASASALLSSGIEGLDDILGGGFPARRFYLVQGDPGAGKTTLGLQFLLEGSRRGERVLYVSLSESREELAAVADSHGWSLEGVPVFELAARDEDLLLERQNTLFEPSEVELAEVTAALLEKVESVDPQRIVFDSLSEMRLLAQNALRYRRHLLALKQHFVSRGRTVLMMDDRTSEEGDLQLQSLAHGVVEMEQLSPLYGPERRRLRVAKMRGISFRGGYHDFRIVKGGLRVFTRLVASEHHEPFAPERVQSGVRELDDLLGGGFDRGTAALFLGPAGSGKSTLAAQYACAAAERGESAAAYLFDEGIPTFVARSLALGMPVERLRQQGKLRLQQVDPAEMSPGEFAQILREDVERRDVRVVVIDSLNGYLAAMPEEHFLVIQMHELLTYLRQRGVVVILVVAQAGIMGAGMQAPVDLSYLSDTVVLLRYYEMQGRIAKAISVLKRRSGGHSTEIRELVLDGKVSVGKASHDLQGIMTGVPVHVRK